MKKTAIVGSEPTLLERLLMPLMNERGVIGDPADPPPAPGDDKSDPPPDGDDRSAPPADDKVPWDKDPRWKEWRGVEQKLQTIMKTNEVESIEALEELIKDGVDIKGRVKDVDIEALMEKAATLEKYEAYWAEQEEARKYEDETDSEKASRLERELKDEKEKLSAKEKEFTERDNAKKAVTAYEREVNLLLRENEGITKEELGFVREFFGVGNPLNDLDITDTKAIKTMVADGIKKKEAYDQAIIQKYIDGKVAIPVIPSGDTATAKPIEAKSLKEARDMFKDQMKKFGRL